MCGALPVIGGRVTSPYGEQRREGRVHHGIDIAAPEGTPVYAVLDGKVIVSAANGEIDGYGIVVVIDHGPWLSLSSHLSSSLVSVGQRVTRGQQIGTVGRTAGTRDNPTREFAEFAHLHFEALDRWPVRQGGVGRLDLGAVFAELGIAAPDGQRLFSTCGGERAVTPARKRRGDGLGLVLVGVLLVSSFADQQGRWPWS